MSDERAFVALNIAVMTVSDSRTEADDKSGNILIERPALRPRPQDKSR